MDIDIDLPTSFSPVDIFHDNIVLASRVENDELRRHPAGAYFQRIAKDSVTGLAAIPFREAEKEGYFKIDFLHLSLLDVFSSKEEVRKLIHRKPDWNLLQIPSVVKKLFQLHDHYDLLQQLKPKSVDDLADCIAIIRPAKRFLVDKYIRDKLATRKALYQAAEGHYFKRPHAIAYALTIVLQLHLIKASIL